MASFVANGAFGVDMDAVDIHMLLSGIVRVASTTTYAVDVNGEVTSFFGEGFVYDTSGNPTAGVVNRITDVLNGQPVYEVTGLSTPAINFVNWALASDSLGMKQALLAGADSFLGSDFGDRLRGFAGDDSMSGKAGNDSIDGGQGNDTVSAGLGNDAIIDAGGQNYLRGDEGDDQVTGGSGFDDINGNMGNDSEAGGLGDDWVVGGKDNDLLLGQDGNDIVYGNLGNDSCDGGVGSDIVRGGQANDILVGGLGDDWLSGDRGDDTISGNGGADVFHTFGEAGIDRVNDFNLAEGDRVMVDPGTVYTVAQVGNDTVITMQGGGQMILMGIQMSTLTGAWIFGA